MGRKPAALTSRKVVTNGKTERWEVRVPAELRKQEAATRRFFAKEIEAKAFCARLKHDLRNYSDKARGLSDAQKIEAQECFERLSQLPGTSLTAAVDEYMLRLAQASRSVTVEELGRVFAETKTLTGGRGSKKGTQREARGIWARFCLAFPERIVSTITAQEIHDWLLPLARADGQPLSLQSRRNIRRVLHTVFNFAKERVRGWIADNPVSEVKLPQGSPHRVVLMPIPQVAQALERAHPKLVPYIALCAFAGLRPDHCKKMTWEQIHFERNEVEVYPGTDKTDPGRLIPLQPNLAAWLRLTPEAQRRGKIFYNRERFRELRAKMGFESWPQDALRHDYATYRLKTTGSFGTVAQEMGNSESVIRSRYVGSVSPSDAEAYWQIFPRS